jgi:hypothetical protein
MIRFHKNNKPLVSDIKKRVSADTDSKDFEFVRIKDKGAHTPHSMLSTWYGKRKAKWLEGRMDALQDKSAARILRGKYYGYTNRFTSAKKPDLKAYFLEEENFKDELSRAENKERLC